MIIIGYQGIGKSTLANKDDKFIDLESGSFGLQIQMVQDIDMIIGMKCIVMWQNIYLNKGILCLYLHMKLLEID